MAFEKIDKRSASRIAGVRLSSAIGHKNLSVRLSFAGDLCEGTDRFALLVGSGEDAGRLLIRPDKNGYVLYRNGQGGAARCLTAPIRSLGIKPPQVSTDIPFEKTDAGLVLDLRAFMPDQS